MMRRDRANLSLSWPGWFIGRNLRQAERRAFWGGIAGLAAAGVNLVVVAITYFGDADIAGVVRPGGAGLLFVLLEAGVMAALSVEILRRRSPGAALALLGYHLISKSVLFGLAAFGLGPGALRSIPFHLIFAYLFLQGLRGAVSWHYLIRQIQPPPAPTIPPE